MKPKVNGNDIRMFVIQPVYQTVNRQMVENGKKVKDELGRRVIIEEDKFVKEIYLKLWFDKRDLTPYGEYVGSKGTVLKNRTKVYCKATQNFYTVAHSLKELEEVLQGSVAPKIGFAKRPDDEI